MKNGVLKLTSSSGLTWGLLRRYLRVYTGLGDVEGMKAFIR